MDRKNASLRDVALAAGVSIRTVNRALKQDGYVQAATRKAILAAAAKVGYQPNLTARALRMGRSDVIAAVLGSMDELHIAKLQAFERTVRAAGFGLLTAFVDGSDKTSEPLPAFLTQRHPAGVAVFQGVIRERRVAIHKQARRLGIPSVFIDTGRDEQLNSVWIDRPHGVREAVLHLAHQGRRRIAYLGPDDQTRLDGYHSAMKELARAPIHIKHYDERSGELDAFFHHKPLPDAVQVYSDVMAMRLLAACHARGVRVPQDLAIVAFDNRDFAAYASPPLTTVAQPNREVGEAAATILLEQINGVPAPKAGWSRAIATTLVRRESG